MPYAPKWEQQEKGGEREGERYRRLKKELGYEIMVCTYKTLVSF
jgi:hypothetical protein